MQLLYVHVFMQSDTGLQWFHITMFRYETILETLKIDRRHEVFWLTKTNTCFTNGVFGTAWVGKHTERDVINYVTQSKFGNTTDGLYVTLVQRKQRRILNVEEMLNASRGMIGNRRPRIVVLEDLPVKEQVTTRRLGLSSRNSLQT